MKKITKISIAILIIGVFTLLSFSDSSNLNTKKYSSIEDIAKEPIAMMAGSTYGQIAIDNGYIDKDTIFF